MMNKKILSIIVLGLLLSGCKHEENYPTSLFGIKLSDKVTNYMTEDEWKNVKAKNKILNFLLQLLVITKETIFLTSIICM